MRIPAAADFASAVTAEIRAELARRKITAQRLAHAVGMSKQTMSRRMTGAAPFDLAEVEAIADFFGMTPSELLARAEQPRQELTA